MIVKKRLTKCTSAPAVTFNSLGGVGQNLKVTRPNGDRGRFVLIFAKAVLIFEKTNCPPLPLRKKKQQYDRTNETDDALPLKTSAPPEVFLFVDES